MTLQQHIDESYAGNIAAFVRHINEAREKPVNRVQVERWIKYGSEWDNGKVKRVVFEV